MDWLVRPLGAGIEWTFQFLEMANWNFNWLMIGVGAALCVYWFKVMLSEKDDKGIYRKP